MTTRDTFLLSGRVERLGAYEAHGERFVSLALRCARAAPDSPANAEGSGLAAGLPDPLEPGGPAGSGERVEWLRARVSRLDDSELFAWSLLAPGDAVEAIAHSEAPHLSILASADPARAPLAAPILELVAFFAPVSGPRTDAFLREAARLALNGERAAPLAAPSGQPQPQRRPAANPARSATSEKLPADYSACAGERPMSDFERERENWPAGSVPRALYAQTLGQVLAEIDTEAWPDRALGRLIWRQGIELFALCSKNESDAAAALADDMARNAQSLNPDLAERACARRAHALLDAARRWSGAASAALGAAPRPEPSASPSSGSGFRASPAGAAMSAPAPFLLHRDGEIVMENVSDDSPVSVFELNAADEPLEGNSALMDLLALAERSPPPQADSKLSQTGLCDPEWSGVVEGLSGPDAAPLGEALAPPDAPEREAIAPPAARPAERQPAQAGTGASAAAHFNPD